MPKQISSKKRDFIFDSIATALIGSLCFLYSMFGVSFAKIYLHIPFLNFPIFIGEIFLGILLALLFIKIRFQPMVRSKFYYLILGLFVFILLKVALGYWKWGPLALRNAALFYYPLFAFISFNFYNKAIFHKRVINILLLFLLIIICFLYMPRHYSFYTYFSLVLVLAYINKNKVIKYSGCILALYFVTRYCLLLDSPKAYVLSGILSFIFLVGALIYSFFKNKISKKLIIISCMLLLTLVSLILFMNPTMRTRLSGSFNFTHIRNEYRLQRSYLNLPDPEEKVADYRHVVFDKVSLYHGDTQFLSGDSTKQIKQPFNNKKQKIENLESTLKKLETKINTQDVILTKKDIESLNESLEKSSSLIMEELEGGYHGFVAENIKNELKSAYAITEDILKDSEINKEQTAKAITYINEALGKARKAREGTTDFQISSVSQERDTYTSLWRLFVWTDMLNDLIENKAFFGISFGKPIIPYSLQRLRYVVGTGWGLGEWVGWVEPHNSYFHILYRTGVVGLVIIATILTLFIKMACGFIKNRSFVGIVLSSAILFYLIISNFIVLMELPQFSIPFWSLFGVTYAYYKKK